MVRRPRGRVLWLLVAIVVVVSACAESAPSRTPVAVVGLEPLAGFESATLIVDGVDEYPVMLAATREQRSQGLMGVTDLGGWAGMAFVFDEPTDAGFWMKDTLIPLTIFWVGSGGRIVGSADMVPCEPGTDCIGYEPGSSYLWALEIRAGTAEELGISLDSTLFLTFDEVAS